MAHLFSRILTDVACHEQVLVLFGVASLLLIFELVFFLKVVVPQVTLHHPQCGVAGGLSRSVVRNVLTHP